ncbi:hypothetical protein pb186bvf_000697 [Paramecium bursaria]
MITVRICMIYRIVFKFYHARLVFNKLNLKIVLTSKRNKIYYKQHDYWNLSSLKQILKQVYFQIGSYDSLTAIPLAKRNKIKIFLYYTQMKSFDQQFI